MDHEATRIADLRGMLAVKRQMLKEHDLGRIELPGDDLRHLHQAMHEDEQALRDLGVDDI